MSTGILFGHNHPAFPQPADANAKIWRYMDFTKFETLAATSRLYMRRADLFLNDEFEGTTPAGDIEYWRKLAENASTPAERATIEHNREELAGYAEVFRKSYFVNCWNLTDAENVAMWERYTSGPESVCLVSTYAKLGAQFDPNLVQYGMVRYIDYETTALPSINMLQRISHKRHFFRDESEVRIVMCALMPDEIRKEFIDPYMMPDGFGWAPPIDLLALVDSVVLHPKATPEFTLTVSELCNANGLPAPRPSKMAGAPRF